MSVFTHSLSSSQPVIAWRKTAADRGAVASAVWRMRSNLMNGFSKKAT